MSFFARLGRFGARTCLFKSSRDALGLDFRAPSEKFFEAFPCNKRAMRKNSGSAKEAVFLRFLACRQLPACDCKQPQMTQDRSRSLSNRASHEVCAKNPSWDSPGSLLDGFGALSGSCWALLGRLLAALGRLLASALEASPFCPRNGGSPVGCVTCLLRKSFVGLGWAM